MNHCSVTQYVRGSVKSYFFLKSAFLTHICNRGSFFFIIVIICLLIRLTMRKLLNYIVVTLKFMHFDMSKKVVIFGLGWLEMENKWPKCLSDNCFWGESKMHFKKKILCTQPLTYCVGFKGESFYTKSIYGIFFPLCTAISGVSKTMITLWILIQI